MRRVALIAVLLFVVAATPVGVVTAAATVPTDGAGNPDAVASQDAPETPSPDNVTGASGNASGADNDGAGASAGLAPGAQLAGVIAVQQAEIDGELAQRSYEVQITTSRSEESKADVVSRQLKQLDGQLADLRTRLNELEAARREGNISEGRYRVTAARLSAEIRSARKMLNETGRTAADLPAETRRANDIGKERLSRLRNGVENLSESSAAATRDLSGPDAGNGLADGDVVNDTKIVGEDACSVAANGGSRGINRSATSGSDSLNGSAGGANASAGACGNDTRVGNATDAPGADNRSNATRNATGAPGLAGGNNTTAGNETAGNATAENASEAPAANADARDSGGRDASDRNDNAENDEGPEDGSEPDNAGGAPGQSDAVGTDRPVTTGADAGTTTGTETEAPTPTDSPTPTEEGDPADAETTTTETATDAPSETETETETDSASEISDDTRNASEGSDEDADDGAVETESEVESEPETESASEAEAGSDAPGDPEDDATDTVVTAGGTAATLSPLFGSDVL